MPPQHVTHTYIPCTYTWPCKADASTYSVGRCSSPCTYRISVEDFPVHYILLFLLSVKHHDGASTWGHNAGSQALATSTHTAVSDLTRIATSRHRLPESGLLWPVCSALALQPREDRLAGAGAGIRGTWGLDPSRPTLEANICKHVFSASRSCICTSI